jgi:hypothetical protein
MFVYYGQRFLRSCISTEGTREIDSSHNASHNLPMNSNQYFRTLVLTVMLWLGAWTPVAFSQGCAMCQTVMPHADEPIARGMLWCVLLLLTAPFAVSATIGGWLWYHYRSAALGQHQEHA